MAEYGDELAEGVGDGAGDGDPVSSQEGFPEPGKGNGGFKEKGIASRYLLTRLPPDLTEDDLREYFSQFGEIEEVTIKRNPEKGHLVGASVKFPKELATPELRSSMLDQDHTINGRRVVVQTWKMQKLARPMVKAEMMRAEMKGEAQAKGGSVGKGVYGAPPAGGYTSGGYSSGAYTSGGSTSGGYGSGGNSSSSGKMGKRGKAGRDYPPVEDSRGRYWQDAFGASKGGHAFPESGYGAWPEDLGWWGAAPYGPFHGGPYGMEMGGYRPGPYGFEKGGYRPGPYGFDMGGHRPGPYDFEKGGHRALPYEYGKADYGKGGKDFDYGRGFKEYEYGKGGKDFEYGRAFRGGYGKACGHDFDGKGYYDRDAGKGFGYGNPGFDMAGLYSGKGAWDEWDPFAGQGYSARSFGKTGHIEGPYGNPYGKGAPGGKAHHDERGGKGKGKEKGKDLTARFLLGDLPDSVDEEAIREYFSHFGVLEDVTLRRHPATGQVKASVKFAEPTLELRRTMLQDTHRIGGTTVSVQTWKMDRIARQTHAAMMNGGEKGGKNGDDQY